MKKTVLVDLDGVLADYSKGWQGVDKIGDPIPGAVEFTKVLSRFARVVIYTTRCSADAPDRSGANVAQLVSRVKAWLDGHGFAYDDIFSGQGKPLAACIIDDRAVNCNPQSPFVKDIGPFDLMPYESAIMAAKNFCGE